jgi:L-ascorbate metabolism protein UlaG (beta-lactamase superfamily)
MQLQLLRHAALVVHLGGKSLLVDPMLSRAEAMDPVANAANARRIPLVELPLTDEQLTQLIGQLDGALVTHVHRDHWDSRAAELLPKNLPILCQPVDVSRFQSEGFANVVPVETGLEWQGLHLERTGGQHGTGDIGQKMGTVSGFILRAAGEPSLYIAGDTIWCADVAAALNQQQPDITVVNAGAAQFLVGDPITMSAADVIQVCQHAPKTQVVAVHMEAVNHCLLLRNDLRAELERAGYTNRVLIPNDGETLTF